MPYTLHPSKKLVALFKEKPWQGCNPATAQFLFLGLDANYAKNIEESLPEIFCYHNDGVEFWQKKGVHHPFMLPKYRGNGKRYHVKFSEIGFTPKHASIVSFVELLPVPTTGRSSLTPEDLSPDQSKLVNILDNGTAKYIFTFRGVTELMKQTKKFPWLRPNPLRMDGDLLVLREKTDQIIYQMYHLSCYGWQLNILNRQIAQIREMVKSLRN